MALFKKKKEEPLKEETYVFFNGEFNEYLKKPTEHYYTRLKKFDKSGVKFNFLDPQLDLFQKEKLDITDEIAGYLFARMAKCKNALLVLSDKTPYISNWLLYELTLAFEGFNLPIIIAYEDTRFVFNPKDKSNLWPDSIARNIIDNDFNAIHIPLSIIPLRQANEDITIYNFKNEKNTYAQFTYSKAKYRDWNIL